MNNILNFKKIAVGVVAILVAVVAFASAPTVFAAGVVHEASGGLRSVYIPRNFQLNSPLPRAVQTYEPGEQFHVQMDFWAGGCNNGPQNVKMRVSQPLAPGESKSYGAWHNVGSRAPVGGHDDYNARWSKSIGPLTAPTEEGIYRVYFHINNHVRWSIGTVSDNWYKGYVEIEVKIPDMCPLMPGAQEEVPAGYVVNSAGECVLSDAFQVLCSASPNPIAPGGSTTFTATPFNAEGDVNFRWYDGSGNFIEQETHGARSRLTRSFADAGIQRVQVRATDENGAEFQRSCGVTVRDPNDPNAGNNGLIDLDGDGIPDTGLGVTGPLAPPAELSLTIERTLTNSTCPIEWNALNVLQCYLVNGTGGVEEVALSGTRDVAPGTYWLRCLARRNSTIEETEPVTCRSNLNIRED